MPSVSVILPTRDRSVLLVRALESLAAQDCRDFEVVVVDDNRSEPRVASQGALAPLLGRLAACVVETGGARNAAAARNRGLAAARGGWITYLDDDDAYAPGKVGAQLALAQSSGAPLVLCGFEVRLPGRVRVRQTDRDHFQGDAVLLDACLGTPFLMHRSGFGARFPEELDAGEDMVFAHRLLAEAGVREVPNVAEPLVRVWPQAGPRVNTKGEEVREAMEVVACERSEDFSPEALARWRGRAALAAFRLGAEGWHGGVTAAAGLLRKGGLREARGVANAFAGRLPFLRRLAVR